MRRERTRNFGFDLSRLHAKSPSTFNAVLLDLIHSKDKILRVGAAKLIFQIALHHFETGKLMCKAKRTETSSKIQIVSSGPSTTRSLNSEQAFLIQQMAHLLLDDLYSRTRMDKPTVGAAIFADTVTLFLQLLCIILNDSAILMDAESPKREELEAQQEALIPTVRKMAVGFVTQLLAWYAASRPLYTQLLKNILVLLESNGGESVLDVGAVAFGELLEMPMLDVDLIDIPVKHRVEQLQVILNEKPRKDEFERRLRDAIWKLAGLISKPPLVLRDKLLVGRYEDILVCMCSIVVMPGIGRSLKQLAVEMMRFVGGVSAMDPKTLKQLDEWFLQSLSSIDVVKRKESVELWETVVDVYLRMDRKKEAQVALLNELLTSWNKGETRFSKQVGSNGLVTEAVSANFKAVLVFILRHPDASPNLYSLLNAYVQKNAAIPKIQQLVEASVQHVEEVS